jgi:putative aminopeptidase FrvX
LLVQYVDPTGFLFCERNGLIDERALLATQLDVWTDEGPRPAVVGVRSRHLMAEEDLRHPVRIEDLWVDVGARSTSEVAELGIEIGAPVTLRSTPVYLSEHMLAGPSIDNRAGCAALVTLAQAAAERDRDTELVFVWSTQEEVGSRGAKVAAQTIQPTIAVVVDTMPAGDPSTPPRRATSVVGGGPVIRVQDARAGVGTIYAPAIKRRLQDLARSIAIPHQLDIFPTWTDACEVHLAGRGIPTGGVFIPRLCSHSPNEILDLRDLTRTIELLEAFLGIGAEQVRGLASRPSFPPGGNSTRIAQ